MWDLEAQVTSTWNPYCRVPPQEGQRVSLVTEKVKYSDVTLSGFGVALVACDIMAVAQGMVALAAAEGQAYRSFM